MHLDVIIKLSVELFIKQTCKFFIDLSFKFYSYAIEDLPFEEEELRTWLQDRWKEKNISLERFHREGKGRKYLPKIKKKTCNK